MKYKVSIKKIKGTTDWLVQETLYEDSTCRVVNMRRKFYCPTHLDALNHSLNLLDHMHHLYLQAVLEKHKEILNES